MNGTPGPKLKEWHSGFHVPKEAIKILFAVVLKNGITKIKFRNNSQQYVCNSRIDAIKSKLSQLDIQHVSFISTLEDL